tara:strand:+ start:3254 stop:3931 length:678 start_codon:yes stop_codon:yes gene_type:complete
MAISADGKIASANRKVNHFSSPADEENLYRLRSTADAIMNGARTVDSAPVLMDAGPLRFRRSRVKQGLAEHPLRIVITGTGSLDTNAEIFKHDFSPIVIVTSRRCPKKRLKQLQQAADKVIVCDEREVNLKNALRSVNRCWPVKRVLCEGGGELNDALFRADLVGDIRLTVCPTVVGGRDAPAISGGLGLQRLSDARRFELVDRKCVGDELFLHYRRMRLHQRHA